MLINATPHVINVYDASDTEYVPSIRKLVLKHRDATPVTVIPPSGMLLNAKITEIEGVPFDGVPTKWVKYEADRLPEGADDYIVSALFANAASVADKPWLLTIGGTVYESVDNPKPCGCTYLIRN